jgi:Cysteine dioxygenase type I
MSVRLAPNVGAAHRVGEAWQRVASRSAHPSNSALGDDVLRAIAAGLAEVTVPWEIRTGEVPSERCYERLLVTPAYEAWVICWPAGTALDLHDHGGSVGAFSVVAGRLDEDRVDDGHVSGRRLGPGDTASFGPSCVHAVSNRGDQPATSIHVYSPPLECMDYYDRSDTGEIVVLRRDPVDRDA